MRTFHVHVVLPYVILYYMYLFRQAWANSVDPDEMPQNGISSGSTLFATLLGRQFTWNVKPYFLWKIQKRNQSSIAVVIASLTFATVWANSADNKLMIFFLIFPENCIWHFMQIDISCKLTQVETVCIKCQIFFFLRRKKKKEKYFNVIWNFYRES